LHVNIKSVSLFEIVEVIDLSFSGVQVSGKNLIGWGRGADLSGALGNTKKSQDGSPDQQRGE
jgi:hypothetical protein